MNEYFRVTETKQPFMRELLENISALLSIYLKTKQRRLMMTKKKIKSHYARQRINLFLILTRLSVGMLVGSYVVNGLF